MVKAKVSAMTSALVCTAALSMAAPAGEQIVGTVESVAVRQQPAVATTGRTPATVVVDPRREILTVTIRGNGEETRRIVTDARTQFIKVATGSRQPTVQFTDARAVLVGKCVDVELRQDHEGVARVIRIRQKDVDPCNRCEAFR